MLLSSPEAYALWAPLYDSRPNPLLALEERLLSDVLGELLHGTVVDVGCGTGRSLGRHRQTCGRGFGVDNSAAMLVQASRKNNLHGKLVLADASALPFRDAVADTTLCSFAISYFPDLVSALSEIARITKSPGWVIISDLHPSAEAKGWTRSFRVNDTTYQIAHAVRSDHELQQALLESGLHELMRINAPFSEQERSLFASAGKDHLFTAAGSTPAVRVSICSKR